MRKKTPSSPLTGKRALHAELERLRAEIAAIKKQNEARPDMHNYSEAETRDYFIDLLLKEAGWPLDKPQDREYPVTGMPIKKVKALWPAEKWDAVPRSTLFSTG